MNESGTGPAPPPGRGGRGRGRGNYSNETRRPALIHTAEQEPIDANIFNASMKATQELHRNMMIQHCLRSWEDSELLIGHGPSPVLAERTEEKREETSEQETLSQASSQDMPQPDIIVDHRPKVDTIDQVKEETITKGDKTKGLASRIRATSTGPTVATTEQPTTMSILPAMVTAKPSPKPPQDLNISSGAAGTAANQHSPPPQQNRGEGRDKVKKSLTFATPSRSKPTAPTPEDNRGTSRDTLGIGAKGTTKDTIALPTPALASSIQDSVDTDRTSSGRVRMN